MRSLDTLSALRVKIAGLKRSANVAFKVCLKSESELQLREYQKI